jgi:hypothetical protein
VGEGKIWSYNTSMLSTHPIFSAYRQARESTLVLGEYFASVN